MVVTAPLFYTEWYLLHNPDVTEAVSQGLIEPLEHFLRYGLKEGRSPGPLFDVQFYLHGNPDVAAAVARGETTAYEHFLTYGIYEGRAPIALFDAAYYLRHNPDVADAVRAGHFTPIQHFVEYGQYEGRIVTPIINLAAYMDANPDVQRAVEDGQMSAMEHLMLYGIREKRGLGNGIDFGMMDGDPVFLRLLAEGKIVDALLRVAEVAPYLPDYGPPDPKPGPDPDPDPQGWGTLENPYPLDPQVDEYQLPNADNFIKLADLSSRTPPPSLERQLVLAGSKYNYFLATSSAALTDKLIIEGGCGCGEPDELYATLDQPVSPTYAPWLFNVPNLYLTAKAGSDPGTIGLDLSNSSGTALIANIGSNANLTVTGVIEPVILAAGGIADRDFIVEYIVVDPADCWGTQYLFIEDAHLRRLSITNEETGGDAAKAITALTITAEGENSIGEFGTGQSNLSSSLTQITVIGSGSFDLNVSELKGNRDSAGDEVKIDFSGYVITGRLNITLAELNTTAGDKHDISDMSGRQSNQYVSLPPLVDGVSIEIQNMTLASTFGYTSGPVKNDVLDLTAWGISDNDGLAGSVTSLKIQLGDAVTGGVSSPHYVNFVFSFDLGVPATLTLRNIVTIDEYNVMLQAIDTVNSDDHLGSTRELIGPGGPSLMAGGPLSNAFSYSLPGADIEISRDPLDGEGNAAILGIIGVLVDEGSFDIV